MLLDRSSKVRLGPTWQIWMQGDQMSLCKNRPKWPIFDKMYALTFTVKENSPEIWATIFYV
jgi:hypothetical protein